MKINLAGIYPITNDAVLARSDYESVIHDVIEGGAAMLQFRAKHGDRNKARKQAKALLEICREYATPLIINDDVALCAAIGADGVHLGIDDANIDDARLELGPDAIIGATCHDSLTLAEEAEQAGASYAAFGSIFPSSSKPAAAPASPSVLLAARIILTVPVAAIGGINRNNAESTFIAGADMLAVVGGIFDAPDPGAAMRELVQIYAAHVTRK